MPVIVEEHKHGGIIVPPRIPPKRFGGGDDGESGGSHSSFPISRGRLAMWLLLTGVTMLFAGLTSAYIVLRGVPSWQNVALPGLVWVNTAILLVSSVTVELAQRAAKADRMLRARHWLIGTTVLGMTFLISQIVVWRELVAAGIYLPTTLHSSFFYVLTGVHGLHIVGGLLAMLLVLYQALKGRLTAASHEPLRLCAVYWHFMDVVWIYLFVLLMLT